VRREWYIRFYRTGKNQLTGKKTTKYIKIIEKSGKRMLNIINDIINISKVESGQIEVLKRN
jgi:signal transduction histidine kinase